MLAAATGSASSSTMEGRRGRVVGSVVTPGTIERIIMGETGFQPILQVLAIKRKAGDVSLTLGDGERYIDAVLSPPAAAIVTKHNIKEKAIVTCNNFFCTTMDQHITMIVLDITAGGSATHASATPDSPSRLFPLSPLDSGARKQGTPSGVPASSAIASPTRLAKRVSRDLSGGGGTIQKRHSRDLGAGGDSASSSPTSVDPSPPEDIPRGLSRGLSFGQGSREYFHEVAKPSPAAQSRRLSRDIALAVTQGVDVESILPELMAAHSGKGHNSILDFLDRGKANEYQSNHTGKQGSSSSPKAQEGDASPEGMPRRLSRGTSFGQGSREWTTQNPSSANRRRSRDLALTAVVSLRQELDSHATRLGRPSTNPTAAAHATRATPHSPLRHEVSIPASTSSVSRGDEDPIILLGGGVAEKSHGLFDYDGQGAEMEDRITEVTPPPELAQEGQKQKRRKNVISRLLHRGKKKHSTNQSASDHPPSQSTHVPLSQRPQPASSAVRSASAAKLQAGVYKQSWVKRKSAMFLHAQRTSRQHIVTPSPETPREEKRELPEIVAVRGYKPSGMSRHSSTGSTGSRKLSKHGSNFGNTMKKSNSTVPPKSKQTSRVAFRSTQPTVAVLPPISPNTPPTSYRGLGGDVVMVAPPPDVCGEDEDIPPPPE